MSITITTRVKAINMVKVGHAFATGVSSTSPRSNGLVLLMWTVRVDVPILIFTVEGSLNSYTSQGLSNEGLASLWLDHQRAPVVPQSALLVPGPYSILFVYLWPPQCLFPLIP